MSQIFSASILKLGTGLLTTSGTDLYLNSIKIGSDLSGWARDVVSGGLQVQIVATGNAAVAHANNLSAVLYTLVTNASGQADTNYATKISLANTGQAAWLAADNNARNLSGRLTQTGIDLLALISAASAGVNSFNGASGALNATGAGNVTVIVNGQTLTFSGDISALATNAKVDSLSGWSAPAQAQYVYRTGDQFIYGTKYFDGTTYIGNLVVTGTQTIVNTQEFDVASNYVTLNATGGARDAGLFISTGLTGASSFGAILGYDVPTNRWVFGLSNRTSDLSALPAIASVTDLVNTSGYLLNVLTNASGLFATAANLTQTGVALINYINSASGGLETRITATGGNAITHANGIGSILSGKLTDSGVALGAKIDALSGYVNQFTGTILAYVTGVTTGVDFQYINHQNYTFPSVPKVTLELEMSDQNVMYFHSISGRSATGFYVLWSNIVYETGLFLNVIARI